MEKPADWTSGHEAILYQLCGACHQPLFEGKFSVNANETADGMETWTANSEGQPTMKGTATW